MDKNSVIVLESDLINAKDDLVAFLSVFTNAYRKVFEEGYTAENMAKLNSKQHTLHAYDLLISGLEEYGFVGLIHNGYGDYFFHNPVEKALKGLGLVRTAKLLYKAHSLYNDCHNELEADMSENDFLIAQEKYEKFEAIEEEILDLYEEEVKILAYYVDEHIEEFAEIKK